MPRHPAKASMASVGFRIGGVVAGTLVLLLAVLAIERPEMMSMASVHALMSAIGL